MSSYVLDQITKIKTPPKVTSNLPKVIEGRWWLSAIYILDPDKEVEDIVVYDDGTDLDEEYEGGLGGAGARTYVALTKTKELE